MIECLRCYSNLLSVIYLVIKTVKKMTIQLLVKSVSFVFLAENGVVYNAFVGFLFNPFSVAPQPSFFFCAENRERGCYCWASPLILSFHGSQVRPGTLSSMNITVLVFALHVLSNWIRFWTSRAISWLYFQMLWRYLWFGWRILFLCDFYNSNM